MHSIGTIHDVVSRARAGKEMRTESAVRILNDAPVCQWGCFCCVSFRYFREFGVDLWLLFLSKPEMQCCRFMQLCFDVNCLTSCCHPKPKPLLVCFRRHSFALISVPLPRRKQLNYWRQPWPGSFETKRLGFLPACLLRPSIAGVRCSILLFQMLIRL